MPEIRQDITTKEWVIIATERSKRPHDFKKKVERDGEQRLDPACPFCPGNEAMTAVDLYRRPHVLNVNGLVWGVRVVPNKFPALIPQGSLNRQVEGVSFHRLDGVGQHEVVIETPHHNRFMFDMDDVEVCSIIHTYRERYNQLKQDKRFKVILIFKNHGKAAGTSLEHPHSQIIAAPVVPAHIRNKYEIATAYFDDNERCIYCDVVQDEINVGARVILRTDLFVAFHPFASQAPFETWIAPLRHRSSFGAISDDEIEDFSSVLRVVLKKLHIGLGNPDFNYVIHTAPLTDENKRYYLWHMQILPRLTTPAGFELGTGMSINTTLPEETAAFMRTVDIS